MPLCDFTTLTGPSHLICTMAVGRKSQQPLPPSSGHTAIVAIIIKKTKAKGSPALGRWLCTSEPGLLILSPSCLCSLLYWFPPSPQPTLLTTMTHSCPSAWTPHTLLTLALSLETSLSSNMCWKCLCTSVTVWPIPSYDKRTICLLSRAEAPCSEGPGLPPSTLYVVGME